MPCQSHLFQASEKPHRCDPGALPSNDIFIRAQEVPVGIPGGGQPASHLPWDKGTVHILAQPSLPRDLCRAPLPQPLQGTAAFSGAELMKGSVFTGSRGPS